MYFARPQAHTFARANVAHPRIPTSNLVRPRSKASSRRSPSWVRSLLNSLAWSPSSGKRCNGSMRIRRISLREPARLAVTSCAESPALTPVRTTPHPFFSLSSSQQRLGRATRASQVLCLGHIQSLAHAQDLWGAHHLCEKTMPKFTGDTRGADPLTPPSHTLPVPRLYSRVIDGARSKSSHERTLHTRDQ